MPASLVYMLDRLEFVEMRYGLGQLARARVAARSSPILIVSIDGLDDLVDQFPGAADQRDLLVTHPGESPAPRRGLKK